MLKNIKTNQSKETMKLSNNKELLKNVRDLMIENNIDRKFYNDENFLKSFIDTFNKAMELVESKKLNKLNQ
jgi:hypothetical protein